MSWECEERIQCYRCGAVNHREDNCYWKDRLCNKCNVKGHKHDMHEVEDAKLREKLINSFPNVRNQNSTQSSETHRSSIHQESQNEVNLRKLGNNV